MHTPRAFLRLVVVVLVLLFQVGSLKEQLRFAESETTVQRRNTQRLTQVSNEGAALLSGSYELPAVFPLASTAALRAVRADAASLWLVDMDARVVWSGLTSDLDRVHVCALSGRQGHRACVDAAMSGKAVVATRSNMAHLLQNHGGGGAGGVAAVTTRDPVCVAAFPIATQVDGQQSVTAVLEVVRHPKPGTTADASAFDADADADADADVGVVFTEEDRLALGLVTNQLRLVLDSTLRVSELQESVQDNEVRVCSCGGGRGCM